MSTAHIAAPTAVDIKKNMDSTGTNWRTNATVPNLPWVLVFRLTIAGKHLRRILQLPLPNSLFPLLFGEVQELKVPPVVKRSAAVASQD